MDQMLKHGLFYNYISNMDEQLTSGRDNGSIKSFICSIQTHTERNSSNLHTLHLIGLFRES